MKICKRCLLGQADAAMYLRLHELIALIPSEERTPEAEYHQRLSCCESCDSLHNGLCSACGCYVEHRAAKKQAHCPYGKQYW